MEDGLATVARRVLRLRPVGWRATLERTRPGPTDTETYGRAGQGVS